jgi:hypothetical protein
MASIPRFIPDNTPDLFYVASLAIPEPDTYALMLSGLGVLVLIARRKTSSRQHQR